MLVAVDDVDDKGVGFGDGASVNEGVGFGDGAFVGAGVGAPVGAGVGALVGAAGVGAGEEDGSCGSGAVG